MMTALGSRSACTVRRGGSAWQLHAEWQTAVPAEHQNQIEILGGGDHGYNNYLTFTAWGNKQLNFLFTTIHVSVRKSSLVILQDKTEQF